MQSQLTEFKKTIVNNFSQRKRLCLVNLINFVSEETPMKKVRNTLLFFFFISCLFLFKPRQDIIFAAISETQYIRLFEKGKDFLLCVEENITYTGTYSLSNDTITLYYEEFTEPGSNHPNTKLTEEIKSLPVKLFIDKAASEIKSADNISFTAQVYLDLRQEMYKAIPNKPRILNSQQATISAIKTGP